MVLTLCSCIMYYLCLQCVIFQVDAQKKGENEWTMLEPNISQQDKPMTDRPGPDIADGPPEVPPVTPTAATDPPTSDSFSGYPPAGK